MFIADARRQALVCIVFDIAETALVVAKKRNPGMHPGIHVGVELNLWLTFVILLGFIIFEVSWRNSNKSSYNQYLNTSTMSEDEWFSKQWALMAFYTILT
jgi:hypothetical protein